MFWIKFIIFSFGLQTVTTQACDSYSDVTQCADGEICRNNVCEQAVNCGRDLYCEWYNELFCVSDYCQSSTCTSTGQCVHGHVCSQGTDRRCVYPVAINVKEGSEVKLAFKEPGTPGTYEEITWYKGDRSRSSRVAVIHPVISDSKTLYFNDLCSGGSRCRTSDRAHLNISTGELTIRSVKFSDEDFYYYEFYSGDGSPDTGLIYEYKLNVYDCDSDSNVTQCTDGNICRNNRCEKALYCTGDSNLCLTTYGLCVSDYCQPDRCTTTGQCVHGHVCCSQDRRCVYPVVSNIKEGSQVKLAFQEPGTAGSYEEIQWYKGSRDSLDRLVFVHPTVTDNKTQYYNEFCSGNSSCCTSDRANFNTDTGELTIFSIQLSDEGFYYYEFFIRDGTPDTGVKYEYTLNVYVLPTTLTIEGVPAEYVEVGTNLTLTCTVDRIKPLALGMYWMVHERNETGALSSTRDGAYTQTTTYMHIVRKEDKSAPIRCVVVPVYGDREEVEAFINPGYAPLGKPRVEVSGNDHYEGEKVTLTCVNPVDEGNPPCSMYIWTRLEGNINYLPATLIYTFIMSQLHAGHYTCQCNNEFGESEVSNVVEILYLGEKPEMSSKDNGGLIAGCVIGVLVLVVLVVAAVFFCRKYQCNFQIKSRRVTAADKVHQEMDGYENPVGPPNEYQYIGAGAMARPGDEGFVNPAVTTYEDVL